jgi:hypothetical protein
MVRATSVRMQNKEVAFKVLACSALRRAMKSLFKGLFYKPVYTKDLYIRGFYANAVTLSNTEVKVHFTK